VDNAQDPAPGKQPTPRANPRSSSTRKPPPVRKPQAKKPAAARKPPAEAPAVDSMDAAEPEITEAQPAAPEPEVAEATPLAPEPEVAELEPEPEVLEPVEAVAPEVEEPVEPAIEEPVEPPRPRAIDVDSPGPDVEIIDLSDPEPEPEVVEPEPAAPAGPSLASSALSWAQRVSASAGSRTATFRERAATKRSEREAAAAARALEAPAAAASTTPELEAQELFPKPAKKARKATADTVLLVRGLTKSFDDNVAVDHIDLEVKTGAFYGIVGPNGAGKTTTLSMITGLLRPDSGTVVVHGSDVWNDTVAAKRHMGVLPDRLRLFDRLTGAQLLYYAGVLRGLEGPVARQRTIDLAHAFGLEDALGRLVSDYSAGMTKKIALAAAMIHSPRLLVLDEPFESVDPVSAATVTEILKKYVAAGGTVVLSSHSMDLVQRICDNVAVVVHGRILADGTMAQVRGGQSLEDRFVELAGGRTTVEGLEWLHSFSD
jgi:ABC-2 type transport system ATP-binding protein